MAAMEAQIRKEQNGQQFRTFSYDLPFHASEANIYPLLAPDGTSIVIYGHEKGLSLYKIHGQSAEVRTLSSKNCQNIIVDNQIESSYNRPKLGKWLNIDLDSPVQHVEFPPISAHTVNNVSHVPDALVSNLIIAVSCEDLTVVLISISLEASDNADEQDVSRPYIRTTYISTGGGHQNAISAIAITWTASNFPKFDKESRSRSRSREADSTNDFLSFLVASASTTGSGLLAVCQIPFYAHFKSKSDIYTIILRQLVRLPLLGCVVSFSPSIYPSSNHLSILLTSPVYGVVKIYDLAKYGIPLSQRGKDSESLTSSDDTTPVTSITAALTLHTAYGCSPQPSRKAILDASWVSSGQAILALLEDGEWGLWDTNLLESVSKPSSGYGKLISLGQLSVTSPIKRSSTTKTSGSLAPMTPHTRKTRSADLFGQTSHFSGGSSASAIKTGQITICGSSQPTTFQDDAFILSYDGIHYYVPSLQAFCRSTFKEGKVRTAGTGRLQVLPEVRLGGGQRLNTQTIRTSSAIKSPNILGTLSQTPDLVVLTDVRLIIVAKAEVQPNGAPSRGLVFRSIGEGEPGVSRSTEQTLDVEGIDNILDGMKGRDLSTDFEEGKEP